MYLGSVHSTGCLHFCSKAHQTKKATLVQQKSIPKPPKKWYEQVFSPSTWLLYIVTSICFLFDYTVLLSSRSWRWVPPPCWLSQRSACVWPGVPKRNGWKDGILDAIQTDLNIYIEVKIMKVMAWCAGCNVLFADRYRHCNISKLS